MGVCFRWAALRLLAPLLAAPLIAHADEGSGWSDASGVWALHLQSTLTEQVHPAFTSPYSGPNSLNASANGRETFDATLYAGLHPWAGGEIWIDPVHLRVVRIEGRVQQDVNFGWGILGRLNKGGWIVIEQAEVVEGQWGIVRLQMQMSGRFVVRNRAFDTTEEETHYAPLPGGMGYREAVEMLLAAK